MFVYLPDSKRWINLDQVQVVIEEAQSLQVRMCGHTDPWIVVRGDDVQVMTEALDSRSPTLITLESTHDR